MFRRHFVLRGKNSQYSRVIMVLRSSCHCYDRAMRILAMESQTHGVVVEFGELWTSSDVESRSDYGMVSDDECLKS
jgi:hypothetical protein